MSGIVSFEIDRYLSEVDECSPFVAKGRVKALVGLLIRATVPDVWMGELCLIYNPRSAHPVKAEVVGFENGDVLLMPLGALVDIGPRSEVIPTGKYLTVKVGNELLGRVLNGLGEPMDAEFNGPLLAKEEYAVYQEAPDPMHRN